MSRSSELFLQIREQEQRDKDRYVDDEFYFDQVQKQTLTNKTTENGNQEKHPHKD